MKRRTAPKGRPTHRPITVAQVEDGLDAAILAGLRAASCRWFAHYLRRRGARRAAW